jgi:hypothetical protein
MAYHTTGTSGFIQWRVPLYVSPAFSITRRAGGVRGGRDADDAFEAVLLKADAKRRQRPLGGEAAAPPGSVQLEPHFDPIFTRPVIELIEADPAYPSTGLLVHRRPRAEPVHVPLSQAVFGEPGDSVRGKVSSSPDGRIAQEPMKLHAVFLAPGPQEELIRLHGGHSVRTLSAHSTNPTNIVGSEKLAFFPTRSASRTPRALEHAPQT